MNTPEMDELEKLAEAHAMGNEYTVTIPGNAPFTYRRISTTKLNSFKAGYRAQSEKLERVKRENVKLQSRIGKLEEALRHICREPLPTCCLKAFQNDDLDNHYHVIADVALTGGANE